MRKKPIAFVILGATALFIAFRMVAPTMTAVVGPMAAPPTPASTETLSAQQATVLTLEAQQAITALEHITIATPDQTPYDRRQFGQAWADVDRNGCDTRNDVLRRDLVDTTLKPGTRGCVVLTGVLHDPYTGQAINFTRGQGTSELVQIDHIVPLAWAWRQGAADWTEEKRQQLANDPLNLLAVDGPTNTSKSSYGPALWLPPRESFRCSYAERFVQVLDSYDLTVTAEDHAALQNELSSCTGSE